MTDISVGYLVNSIANPVYEGCIPIQGSFTSYYIVNIKAFNTQPQSIFYYPIHIHTGLTRKARQALTSADQGESSRISIYHI